MISCVFFNFCLLILSATASVIVELKNICILQVIKTHEMKSLAFVGTLSRSFKRTRYGSKLAKEKRPPFHSFFSTIARVFTENMNLKHVKTWVETVVQFLARRYLSPILLKVNRLSFKKPHFLFCTYIFEVYVSEVGIIQSCPNRTFCNVLSRVSDLEMTCEIQWGFSGAG